MMFELKRSFPAHLLSAAAVFASMTAVGQTPVAMSQPLPVDAALRVGKLDNGFTYYIRPVKSAARRIKLNLIVKAGTDQEDVDQAEIAHVTEHVNFAGAGPSMDSMFARLEKFGLRRGEDINASTEPVRTEYCLSIPADDAALLQTGLQVTREWAQGALLRDDVIDNERKAVIEEIRTYLTNELSGLPEQYRPMLLNGAGPPGYYAPEYRRAERERQLLHFKPDVLRRFHADWYRPDLQALIVVGDVDAAAVEARIKALFSDLKMPANPRERKDYPAKLTGHGQFIAITHPGLTELEIQIHEKRLETQAQLTVADYRAALIAGLYDSMLIQRLQARKREYSITLFSSESRIHLLPNLVETDTRIAAAVPDWQKALQSVVKEIERVRRFGFMPGEFQAAQEKWLQPPDAENLLRGYVSGLANSFVIGSVPMTPDARLELTRKLLAEMTPQTVSQTVQGWKRDSDRDIVVLAPASAQQALPNQAMIDALITQASSAHLDPLSEERIGSLLLAAHKVPKKGSRVKLESEDARLGITIARLTQNGVKVVMKPGVGAGRIAITLFGPGGLSLVPDPEYLSAYAASGLALEVGAGGFSKAEIDRYSSARKLELRPYMTNSEHGMRGEAQSADFEGLMQLMYLYCTAVNPDRSVFEPFIRSWRAGLEESAGQILATKFKRLDGDNMRRSGDPVTAQNIDSIDFAVAQRIFRERFGTAGNLTLVVAGDFSAQQVLPMVAKYLGALPAGKPGSSPPALPPVRAGASHETLYGGPPGIATVAIAFRGDLPAGMRARLELEAVSGIFQAVLLHRLRAVEAGTYSVLGGVLKIRDGRYQISITFQCAPENAQRLMQAAQEEITRLRMQGPAAQDVRNFLAADEQRMKQDFQSIEFWQRYLAEQVREHAPLDAVLKRGEWRSGMNSDVVRQAVRRYLDENSQADFILLPEKPGAAVGDLPRPASDELAVRMVHTNDVKEFTQNFGQGRMAPVREDMAPNGVLTTLLILSGCKRDEHGDCNVVGRFTLLDPQGAVVSRSMDAWPVLAGKPAPEASGWQLSDTHPQVRFVSPPTLVGKYTVKASVTDLNSKVTREVEQTVVVRSGT